MAGAPRRLSTGQPGEQGPTFARFGNAVNQHRQETAEWPREESNSGICLHLHASLITQAHSPKLQGHQVCVQKSKQLPGNYSERKPWSFAHSIVLFAKELLPLPPFKEGPHLVQQPTMEPCREPA